LGKNKQKFLNLQMAERRIKIFKTFEEMNAYDLECMANTTPKRTFCDLYSECKSSQTYSINSPRIKEILLSAMDILNNEFRLFLTSARKTNLKYLVVGDMKRRSRRDMDLWDVARLDEIKNLKNKK
jgi:hypothetical protein